MMARASMSLLVASLCCLAAMLRLVPTALATGITQIEADQAAVPLYAKFQVTFQLTSAYANPFDPDEVDAELTVVTPSRDTLVVPAFWFQDFARSRTSTDEILAAVGSLCWMARFSPTELGIHTYYIGVADSTGYNRSPDSTFAAIASSDPGFVGRSAADSRLFEFSNGDPYVPRGQNIAWATNLGTYDYDTYVNAMTANGENWMRIWMTHFYRGQSLEWNASHWTGYFHGLGVYSQECAWKLDYIIEFARQHGIRIQLVTQHHGQFSTSTDANWADNPYNVANGGMLTAPQQFFTNAQAKQLYKRKLRYMVARWGYSTSILCWEFWNEVQYTNNYSPSTVASWHGEMGQYVDSIDPWHHLLTTSARETDSVIWSRPEIDCTQLHLYVGEVTNTIRSKVISMWSYGKPVIAGEFGYYPHEQGWADTDGTHLHNGIWSAAMAMTGAMPWWWDNYIYPNNLYYHFAGLAGFFEGEDLRHPRLEPVSPAVGGNAAARSYAIGDSTCAYLWIKDAGNEIGGTPQDTLRGVWAKVPGMASGTYSVEFWNTFTGTMTSTDEVECSGDTLSIAVPAFHLDVGIKVKNEDLAGVGSWSDPAGTGIMSLRAWPNPFSASTALVLGNTQVPGSDLCIYDVAGKLVWFARRASLGPISWDGKDLAGASLPSGVYFVRAQAGTRDALSKIVLLR
jgi:hypothetical protein